MTDQWIVTVPGRARAQPRPRWQGHGKRPVSTADHPARRWRRAVCAAVAQITGCNYTPPLHAVAVEMVFSFASADRAIWGCTHVGKPDSDNLAKLVLDAMADAGAFPRGDQAVADLKARKVWGPRGGVTIRWGPATAAPAATTPGANEPPSWLKGPVTDEVQD